MKLDTFLEKVYSMAKHDNPSGVPSLVVIEFGRLTKIKYLFVEAGLLASAPACGKGANQVYAFKNKEPMKSESVAKALKKQFSRMGYTVNVYCVEV